MATDEEDIVLKGNKLMQVALQKNVFGLNPNALLRSRFEGERYQEHQIS